MLYFDLDSLAIDHFENFIELLSNSPKGLCTFLFQILFLPPPPPNNFFQHKAIRVARVSFVSVLIVKEG